MPAPTSRTTTPTQPPPPPSAPLPPLPPGSSTSPRLPPLPSLPPLSTSAFTSTSNPAHRLSSDVLVPAAAGSNSPASSHLSTASEAFSRLSTGTAATGLEGGAASTRPSSVESLTPVPGSPIKPPPPALAIPLPSVPSAGATPPLDTPAALLAALSLDAAEGAQEVPPLPHFAPFAGAAAMDGEALEGCGCEVEGSPLLDKESGDEEEDEGDEALVAEAEVEALLLSAQAHLSAPSPSSFAPTFPSTFAAGKRPSLPLPALPSAMGPRGSVSGSAFVEEGLARMPEHHVAEAGEGGVLGASLPALAAGEPLHERQRRLAKVLLRRKSGREGKKKPQAPAFERFVMPSTEDLVAAEACELVGEGGSSVTFGELIKKRGERRTVVIFLRHAWCGLCAQYVEALNRATVNLVSLSTTSFIQLGHGERGPTIPPLYIVLINSAAPSLISTYRARMGTPFPLYSDRSRALYKALGMTKKTWDMGKDSEKGSYIVKSQLGNITSSISAGVAMRAYPGSQTQLGGEFVFEQSLEDGSVKCLYASRMHNTRAHAEIEDVFAAAGVQLNAEDAASVYGDLGE
ncbi:hypothetical protein JCM10449v2_007447 [Rhodotorula kratochvilovae]